MTATLRDDFARADNTADLGSDWRVESGSIQVAKEAATQAVGFVSPARAAHLTPLDKPDQQVAAWVRIAVDTGSPWVEVFVRGKEDVAGSPFDTSNLYAVRLTRDSDGDTLTIQKLNAGVYKKLGTIDVTLGSPKDSLFPIAIGIQDAGGFNEIFAYFSDLDTPRFSIIDRTVPLWKTVGLVGFAVFEGAGAGAPVTAVDRFEATILDVEEKDQIEKEAPIKWTLKEIRENAQFRLDQGGVSNVNSSQMDDFINFAEQQFVLEAGDMHWQKRLFPITTQKLNRFIHLPRRASEEIISIDDITNGVTLLEVDLRELSLRTDGNRRTSSGTPDVYAKAGMGVGDRQRLELFPKPSGEFALEIFARAIPGHMVDDSDHPMIPQRFVEALIHGALIRGGMLTGNDKLLSWHQAQWNRFVQGAKDANRRGSATVFHSQRSIPVLRQAPRTRKDQLGSRFF